MCEEIENKQDQLSESLRSTHNEYKSGKVEILQKLSAKMERLSSEQAAGVARLGCNALKCPRLLILLPVRSRRSVVHRAINKEEYLVYFLCAHDKSLVTTTMTIKQPRKWVEKAAPLLKVTIFTLKILTLACGIPLPNLPDFVPGSSAHAKLNSCIKEMGELLSLEGLQEIEGWIESCDSASDCSRYLETVVRDIPIEAYAALVIEAYKPKHIGWMEKMQIARRGDIYAWVKKENKESFESS
uniref:Uncharacterized protein n=1 Tax=Cyclophora tenuis TaxID=216820 RepID=A0A7S1D1P7_CYCTE|mmetsp:Transcript_16644/g.28219  ORF Transcript_16644/g.28219 Transcript_16644/m.28219 type:complete len:242 (+) Transcript_16644:3-728(+)